jgi:hypothetical protein
MHSDLDVQARGQQQRECIALACRAAAKAAVPEWHLDRDRSFAGRRPNHKVRSDLQLASLYAARACVHVGARSA